MFRLVLGVAVVGFLPPALVAAPLPKDQKPAISPETVNRLKPVGELERDVYRLVWGPKAGEVALLSFSQQAEVIDETTLKPIRRIGAGRPVIHMAVARDRETVASAENGTRVEVHGAKADKPLVIETGMSQPDAAFSPDGRLLATGGSGIQAKLWELPSGKFVRSLDAGGEGGLTVVFSPDGKTLAVGNRNYTTRLYEVSTGKLLHNLDKAMSQGLKFSPDGKLLAVAYVDGTVGLWDVAAGKLVRSAPAKAEEVYEVDWTPKGDVLVTAGRQGKIVLWDPKELKPLRELESPEWVIQARFTPDGTRLWTAGGGIDQGTERKIVIWGLADR
jgi:WD40 repeat protein